MVHRMGEEKDSNLQSMLQNPEQLEILSAEIPTVNLGETVVSALRRSGVVSSNGEALRMIKQNAISVNGQKVTEDQQIIEPALIKKGKNQFVLVR